MGRFLVRNPPPHVGGYAIPVIFRHALSFSLSACQLASFVSPRLAAASSAHPHQTAPNRTRKFFHARHAPRPSYTHLQSSTANYTYLHQKT